MQKGQPAGSLPMLQAQEFKKKTVPLGIIVPL